MAFLYADENVSYRLVNLLTPLGHDVLTARDDGRANQQIPDPLVLARAVLLGRTVLTNNRRHYHILHRLIPNHAGIVTYTDDDLPVLAVRIDTAIHSVPSLNGVLIRVVRANPTTGT